MGVYRPMTVSISCTHIDRFISWLGVTVSKFYDWRQRYGRVNEHNGWVPREAGLLSRWKSNLSRKGTGFEQPLQPHQHWHVDVSYINLSGTFYYLCSVLDGCSRF